MAQQTQEKTWLEAPVPIELTAEEILADLDEGWSTWEPTPLEAARS